MTTPYDKVSRRLLVSLDATGYGTADDRRKAIMHADLRSVVADAAQRAGLERDRWYVEPGGDGELAVLPPDASEPGTVDAFPRELAALLDDRNDGRVGGGRLRVRLAIHFGVAIRTTAGTYTGKGLTDVSRIVDCRPLRAALDRAPTDLVVAVSQQVFADTVVQRHTSLSPSAFRRVETHNKEFRQPVWLYVPRGDVHSLDIDGPDGNPADGPGTAPDTPRSAASDGSGGTSVHTEFHGTQTFGDGTVIGIANQDRRR